MNLSDTAVTLQKSIRIAEICTCDVKKPNIYISMKKDVVLLKYRKQMLCLVIITVGRICHIL